LVAGLAEAVLVGFEAVLVVFLLVAMESKLLIFFTRDWKNIPP
jgi:hypothetical protein